MFSLTIVAVIVTTFIVLARKNWNNLIGSGPTILICGALVLCVYGGIKWTDYQGRLQDHNVCISRYDASTQARDFNVLLTDIIARELPGRSDIVGELREKIPEQLKQCPSRPTFFTSFKEGF